MLNKERAKVLLAQNGILFALIAIIIFFSIANPRFFSLQNAQTVLLQIADLGLVAIPLALIVMSGSVDLSIGSIASVSGITSAMVMVSTGNWVVGVLAGLALGAFAGALNGVLTAYLDLNPLVVTLGFLSVWGGMALYLTSGSTVAGLPEAFRALGSLSVLGVPLQVVILLIVVVLGWYLLNKRPFGRQLLAIGGNERASYLMGIKVRSIRVRLFIIAGVLSALAGIMLSAKLQAATPITGVSMEVQALTVVLLGGVAFEGGSGRIGGVVIGLLFVGVLRNGLVILGVSQFVQTILVGLMLVIAVAMDRTMQKIVQRSWNRIVKKQNQVARTA